MKTFNISNNNNGSSSSNNNISSAVNNNTLSGKHGFDKRDITFDKRYQEPIKPFDPYFVDMKREAVPGVALGGLGHKPYHGLDARLEQPIKLTKPLNTVANNEEEEDDDDDRLRLVIAHRENGSPEDSDHESSESAEHSV